jgi:multiple sugar transport system substrate-binding protein
LVPQTFEELLATAKAVKTNEMSGIAMRAQASGNSSPAAMSYVFSYGGHMVKDNEAAFASPEAISAVAMYGETLSQAGPVGVGSYEWYHVLNDFIQGRTAMAIDSSVLARDISDPAKSRVAKQAEFAAFPHVAGRAPVPFMSPTSLQTAAVGLATTRLSAWSSEAFKKTFGPQAAAAALTNLQNADVDRAKAILFHPQSRPIQDAFMIGVNEVVSGAKSAKSAMTAAAEKANAAIRG